MILIVTVENDQSTMNVIEWLVFKNQPFIILHPRDNVNFSFKNDEYYIEVDSKLIDLKQIKSFWYRRGFISLEKIRTDKNELSRIIFEENKSILEFLYYLLEKKRHVNKLMDNEINKLITLSIAEECKLLVPKSYYNINRFGLEPKITKAIVGSASFIKNNKAFVMFTKTISNKELKKTYRYRYTQEQILKKYELRIFFLQGKFWSMAIFSQKDKQTRVDFREYNFRKPNRNVPYKLPTKIKQNLTKLMTKLNINCGSIDMILSKKNEYVFLEVNPIGQFGMISYPCNYNLEEEIANYLSYGE